MIAPTQQSDALSPIVHLVDRVRDDHADVAIVALRDQARSQLLDQGLPGPRDENWRFTRLDPLIEQARTGFAAPDPADAGRDVTAAIDRARIDGLDTIDLVFVNGVFAPDRSTPAPDDQPDLFEHHVRRMPEAGGRAVTELLRRFRADDAFSLMNTAMLRDGVFIDLPAETRLDRPLRILHVATGDRPFWTSPRTIIRAGRDAELTVIEHYVHQDAGVYCNNAVTQIFAHERAEVEHVWIEDESLEAFNFAMLETHQLADSRVRSHSGLFGGSLVRNSVHPTLAGERAECLVNGIYVGVGRQHLDNYMLVRHAEPRGDSRQFYRGILDDQARAVFCGRISVAEGAQKTDAKQSDANLLLSDDARANAMPQLEIYADDVKCTHGATAGQLDDEAIFYLRSRGVDAATARGLMVYSFAAESLNRVESEPIRRMLQKRLIDKLTLDPLLLDTLDVEHATPDPAAA